MSDYREWDQYYQNYPLEELGWELGKPRPILVEYKEKGLLPKGGKALDLCCGAGTNTIYLAQSNYDATGLDISETALGIARQQARRANVMIDFVRGSFVDLSLAESRFAFVYDMGCFHHVEVEERAKFIAGIHRVLQDKGCYMLTCFSYRNGPGWNHFIWPQLTDLFSGYFEFGDFRDYSSLEGDGVIRFFYTVLMTRKAM